MKKLLLLLLSLLISSQSFAQDPEIFDTWYLHNLIINGQDHIPSNLTQNLECTYYDFNVNGDGYTFYFPNEHSLETFQVTYDPVNPEFVMVDLVGLTLGICSSQECYDFFAIYSPFYFDYTNTVMTYEIVINTDGTKTLIIANIDGDQAIYNTEALLSTQDFLTPEYVLYPNPVLNDLFISSENLLIERIRIYSISGKEVLNVESIEKSIDVSRLQQGIYFIEVTSAEGRSVQKFIKN